MSKVKAKALRRRQRQLNKSETSSPSGRSETDQSPSSSPLDGLSRRRGSRGGNATATATRDCFRSPVAAVANVLVLATLSCLAAPAGGLVIEEPFSATFDHVAAAFGPDLLNIDPPVEKRPLVRARPRDGCTPLQNTMDEGAIALVQRGTCNFTQKVLYAQEAGASAVVVTDSPATEKWLMIMYGDPENAKGIEIPAVLVSHATGERLWSNRSWIPGWQGKLKASVGAQGHIVLQPRPVGALEMLGIYLLLSVLLLAFSGVCGLLFALAFTWYQRGYRTRAMRKLKSFTFRRRTHDAPAPAPAPAPSFPALEETINPTDNSTASSTSTSTDGNSGREGCTAAAAATTAEAGAIAGPGHGLEPSNSNGEGVPPAGEGERSSSSSSSPRRRRPRACGDDSCENCGGGHGGARARDGDGHGRGHGAESCGNTAAATTTTTGAGSSSPTVSVGGRGGDTNSSSSSSGGGGGGDDLVGAEDDLCAICLETYEDGDSLTGLPCRHSFHTHCIQPWLSAKSALCPMCKSDAFGKGGLFLTTAPRLEALFAELAALCTENLAVLGMFFLASVACGVIAARLSLRD